MLLFTIRPDSGEPYELRATTRDVLAWEKIGKDNKLARIRSDPTLTDIYSIAHFAAKRQQLFTGSLTEFEESVDIDFEEEDNAEADPTQLDR